MTTDRPLCVLLGALGGQGGGVLTNWLVEAAWQAGYAAQATSIPGVAQRTGATTYYFELFPKKNPAADPVFCLFPSAGGVDLVAALEPTEAGRALEHGYVTGGTTVITSTQRTYSTAEKSIAGEGALDLSPLLAALERVAQSLIRADPAAAPDSAVNALIFGAVIGSGVLPLTEENARAAIQSVGLAVDSNLAGFEAGMRSARTPAGRFPILPESRYDPAPPGFEGELADFPEALRLLVGHGLARLVDYQDDAYAKRYLDCLKPVLDQDRSAGASASAFRLTREVAVQLATWMTYEDAIRVAQLKTRPGRLTRIRQEVGAHPGEPFEIHDFLSPGRSEFVSLVPASIARLLAGKNRKYGAEAGGRALAWPTSSPWGYAALKFLAALRSIRRHTLTFAREQAAIETWLNAVKRAFLVDYDLACLTAKLAVWARGYGDVRARGLACLEFALEDWEQRISKNPDAVRDAVHASLDAARNDPDSLCNHAGKST